MRFHRILVDSRESVFLLNNDFCFFESLGQIAPVDGMLVANIAIGIEFAETMEKPRPQRIRLMKAWSIVAQGLLQGGCGGQVLVLDLDQ